MYHRLHLHHTALQLKLKPGYLGRPPTGRFPTTKPNPLATDIGIRFNMSTSTFTLPGTNLQINTTPELHQDELLSFPAFKTWLSTLQNSLARQSNPSHEFHRDPYVLRRIDIQAVDHFGGGRLGFVKLKADVSNGQGEKLPGSVFLRGGSVGMLVCYCLFTLLFPTIVTDNYISSLFYSQTTFPHRRKKANVSF